MTPEGLIVNRILKRLNATPGCRAEKRHGSRYGSGGRPDISGCLNGRRFEIEVKAPGGHATKRQWHELMQWGAAGAIVGVAHSVDEAVKILNDGGVK